MLLVDGSSYLYRAYHALPDLRGPDNVPTGALHGFVAMMKRLREQFPAEHAACVFDAKGRTFRDDWYAEYKANRAPMPEPLVQQIAPIHEVVRLLGWMVLEVPGIEADDAIGTLARAAAATGHRVIISTGDKDLAQLVDANVTLINTMTNERLDVAGVQDKFGVPPERIVDYLTLVGDSVDNVPGVDKVGPKTAVKWLAEHGSLDGVIAAAEGMKGAVGEHLRKALPWLPQAKKLVTVVTDCDLAGHVPGWPSLDGLHFNAVDRDGLLSFFERHGLKTFRKELLAADATGAPAAGEAPAEDGSAPPPAVVASDLRYDTVLTMAALDEWVAKVAAAPLTALDTETDSLDAMQAQLVGISLAVAPGEAAYIPLRHSYAGAPDQLPVAEVLDRLRPWLEDAAKPKLGQNIKYDTHVFANAGITVRGYVHDTMLESYVLEAHKPHGLESLALRHLNRSGLSYEDLCGKGAHQIPFAQVDIDKAARYSGEDSEMCLHVHRALWPQITAEAGLRFVYEHIEMPTAAVLARIERTGVLIDSALLATQSRELAERMLALEAEAHALAGQPFNLGSPKQIGEILFGKLGLPVGRKTATGAPSTDEAELEKLAADFPLPAKLLEHRGLSKLKGTYTDKLPLMVNPATGRVHTNYAQAVAVTGRLSSNDPNLQNIPVRTELGRQIRRAFYAAPGYELLSLDYSQIELRVLAHMCQDENLVTAFRERVDVHTVTAALMFGIENEVVTKEQRRLAKMLNYAVLYGVTGFGLANQLGAGFSASEANNLIKQYNERFPAVKAFTDTIIDEARAKGFTATMIGRRRYFPDIHAANRQLRTYAERQAMNAPIQGTAADMIKLAMLDVRHKLDLGDTRMLLQVHDELVFEVPTGDRSMVEPIRKAMESALLLGEVPVEVDAKVGANWLEMTPITA